MIAPECCPCSPLPTLSDVIEKLNVTIERDGVVSLAEIHGSVRLKSFLQGAPELKIMLNRDLFVGDTPPELGRKCELGHAPEVGKM